MQQPKPKRPRRKKGESSKLPRKQSKMQRISKSNSKRRLKKRLLTKLREKRKNNRFKTN